MDCATLTVDDQTTIHVWDGGKVVLEADTSKIDTYIRGINLIKSNENVYNVYNAHGDVVELTDNNGAVTKSYVYDDNGNHISTKQYSRILQ